MRNLCTLINRRISCAPKVEPGILINKIHSLIKKSRLQRLPEAVLRKK